MIQIQVIKVRLEEARQEDRWDTIVQDVCGRNLSNGSEGDEPRWALEVVLAIEDLNRMLRKEQERRSRMTEKMYRIVVEEKKLAEAEKVQRRSEKKQARKLAKAEAAVQAAPLG